MLSLHFGAVGPMVSGRDQSDSHTRATFSQVDLTIEEAARRLKRDPELVRRWIREGRLEARKVGSAYVVSPSVLRRFRPPARRPRGTLWIRADPSWEWHAVQGEHPHPAATVALCGAWLGGASVAPSAWPVRRQRPPVDACRECADVVRSKPIDSGIGGAAMAAGANYQACVIAFVATHILAQHQLGWLPPTHDVPTALAAETGGPGDDLRIEYGIHRDPAEAQIKRGADATTLRGAVDRVVERWRASGKHVEVVMVVDRRSSGSVRTELTDDLDRLRADRRDPLGELATALVGELGDEADVLKDIHVEECAVDVATGSATSLALELLKRALVDPSQANLAWRALIADASDVSSRRLARTRDDLVQLLTGSGIAVRPPEPSQRFHQALDASRRMLERGQVAAVLTYLDQVERDLTHERGLGGPPVEPRVHHRLAQQRAVALFRLGQFRDSLGSARKALEYDASGLHALTIAARAALFAADLDTAREFAKAATRQHPRDPEAWGVLAEVSSAAGETLPEAPSSIGSAPRYREFLAQSAASRQDWSRVLELTTPLLADGDRSSDVLGLRTMALINTAAGQAPEVASNQLNDAERLATELIDLTEDQTNPLTAMALTWRSIARRELGRTQEADADLADARRLHPDDPEALRSAADRYMEIDDFDGALRVLRDPSVDREPLLLAMRAACLVGLSKKDEARIDLDATVAQLTPNSPAQANVLAANVAIELGNVDLARRLLDQMRNPETFPVPAQAQLERVRGRMAFASGDIEEAIRRFRVAAEQDAPNRWLTLGELARRLVSAKRDEDAVSVYREIPVDQLPEAVVSNSASLFFRLHDYEQAWAIAEHALTLAPPPIWALELAIDIALRRDDQATAMRHLRELIQREESSPNARVVLGRCLLENDRPEEAAEQIDWLVGRNDLTPEYLMATAELLSAAGLTDDSVRFGLRALRRARQDPRMHRALTGLVLTGKPALPVVVVVGPGTHVRVSRSDGAIREWTIYEDEPIDRARNELSVAEADAQGLLGKLTGDVVMFGSFLAEPWKILEILPAIVYEVRDIIERYEARFPGDPFIQGFSVGNADSVKDFAPMIQLLQARRERVEKALELTRRQTLPLGVAAKIAGVGVAEVMEGLRVTPSLRPLFVEWSDAAGQAQSREAARSAQTVVLTRSALETASQLELLEVLQRGFTLVAPRSLGRLLKQERELADKATREKTAFIGAGPAGMPWLTEHEPEDPLIRRRATDARLREQWLTAFARLEVRPLASVHAPGSREEEARESLGHDSYDAIQLAAALGSALYADDLGLRRFATPLGVASFSTLSLLTALVDRGLLSPDQRDRHVTTLVGMHYAQAAPTPALLRLALRTDTDEQTRQLVFGLLGASTLIAPVDSARMAMTAIRETALVNVRTWSAAQVTHYALNGMARGWQPRLCADAMVRAAREQLRFLHDDLTMVLRSCREFIERQP